MIDKPEPMLWLSDSRGVYIPRDFAQSLTDGDGKRSHVTGISDEQWETLEAGPDTEYYWDVWDEVLTSAVVIDENGVKHMLHQFGDLWLIPEGMEWNDGIEWFQWPEDDNSDYRLEDKKAD